MIFNLIKKIKWSMVTASVATLVATPVAMGEEAKARFAKQTMADAIVSTGLNKPQTVSQFYLKNKNQFPERVQKIMEGFVKLYGSSQMPVFNVTTALDSNGDKITVLRGTSGNQISTIQLFGEPDKFVKFDNTVLSEDDIINIDDMFNKLTNHEPNLRRQVTGEVAGAFDFKGQSTSAQSGPKTFQYPDVDKKSWAKMSTNDKAHYIVNMKRLWASSINVLNAKPTTKGQKKVKTSEFNFLELLFNQNAFAETPPNNAPTNAPEVSSTDGFSIKVDQNNSCIIAGYTSEYVNDRCSAVKVKEIYQLKAGNNPVLDKVYKSCGPKQIPCNPYIYGVDASSGNGFCVDLDSSKGSILQTATTYEGKCEGGRQLGSKIEISQVKGKDRYKDLNSADLEKKLKEEFDNKSNDDPAVQNVENFLKGLLKFNSKGEKDTAFDSNTKISDEVLDQIRDIRKVFNKDINEARKSCLASAKNRDKQETYFFDACDQLQRRFLFVKEFLQKRPGCPDKGTIDENTLKCSCPNSSVSVNPGDSCKSAAGPKPVETASCKDPSGNVCDLEKNKCVESTIGDGVIVKCVPKDSKPEDKPPKAGAICGAVTCAADEICKDNYTSGTGVKDRSCVKDPKAPGAATAKTSFWDGWFGKFLKGTWDVTKKIAPYAGVGLGLYLLYKVTTPKIPKIKNPGDQCSNGVTVAPCPQACGAFQIRNANGVCGCPLPAPGLYLVDSTLCTYNNAPATGTVTLITCGDGVTQVTDRANCPAPVVNSSETSTKVVPTKINNKAGTSK